MLAKGILTLVGAEECLLAGFCASRASSEPIHPVSKQTLRDLTREISQLRSRVNALAPQGGRRGTTAGKSLVAWQQVSLGGGALSF